MMSEKNFHWNVEQWVTEVAIRTSLKEDLYVILSAVAEYGSATFQILVNPLVVWLWIGGGLMLLGTTVAIWPDDKGDSGPAAQSDSQEEDEKQEGRSRRSRKR